MDAHQEESKNMKESHSSSSSSSSLSCNSSSSYSSTSLNASAVPLSELHRKPPMPDHLFNEWLRFFNVDDAGHDHRMDQWKEIEKRFDRLAITSNGSDQHVVKWSDFDFCIGE